MDKDLLSMIISDMIFRATDFGPSKSICDPFAEAVIAEAKSVNYRMKLHYGVGVKRD